MNRNYVVFECRKCGHLLFADKINKTLLQGIMNYNCPSCGEEGYSNWILLKMASESEMS
jgi:predicted RNA-binding Zn-ribbon protein involved in translation (DUF1610 family)